MPPTADFPLPLAAYPVTTGLIDTLRTRVAIEPVNGAAAAIFFLAIFHTFAAPKFTALAHRVQDAHDARTDARGVRRFPGVLAEILHFLGEVEVVFGLWAALLLAVSRLQRLGGRHALFQRDGEFHRAAVRDRDHGSRLYTTESSASPKPRCDTSQMRAAARPRRGG